ncbi:MAG: M14 family zinc carboxypeptidase [Ignavibacteria bacterium]|jgi:hypothetical protein
MKNLIVIFSLIILLKGNLLSQNFLTYSFYENHHKYLEKSITDRRFKNSAIVELIKNLDKDIFKYRVAGKSLEGRDIYLISAGSGDVDVLLWSQMHGDEPTATMALFDIFNFFSANDDYNNFRKNILKTLKLHFIPMLNPDGAQNFERRNALEIDLNRDALRLQFPESRTLKAVRDSIKPKFGFNLHDQNTRYSAGRSFQTATISFLAPPFNYERDINEVRSNTMKLIVNLYQELSKIIPGHIGRYDDEFEPRAFGDNFIKWGTSSVLIESGGWKNDSEKQFVRKLNFTALLTAFESISNRYYQNADIEIYNTIPENDKLIFNKLFRNLKYNYNGKHYTVDIGVNQDEKNINGAENFYLTSNIEDFGDLSIFYGYEDFNCEGMVLEKGKTYEKIFDNYDELKNIDFSSLHKMGYTSIKVKKIPEGINFSKFPINIISNENSYSNEITVDEPANFIIKEKNLIKYVILNGFVINLNVQKNIKMNGLLFE